MAKVKYPTLVSQTTGGHYATFSNANNVKTSANYAQCTVQGKKKTVNRPSTLKVGGFGAGLPTGAFVTNVTVKFKHSKVAVNGSVCNVPAPTVSLYNGDTRLISKKSQAPTTTPTERSVSFATKLNYDLVNSSLFRVHLDYPTNANDYSGYLRVYYIQIIITYKTANYLLNGSISDGYQGETTFLNVGVSNPNMVRTAPQVTIVLDTGLSVKGYDSDANVQRINARTLIWTPKQSVDVDNLMVECDVNVTFPSGTESLTRSVSISENLSSHSKSFSCTIYKNKPVNPEDEEEPNPSKEPLPEDAEITLDIPEEVIYANKYTDFYVNIDDILEFIEAKGIDIDTIDGRSQTYTSWLYFKSNSELLYMDPNYSTDSHNPDGSVDYGISDINMERCNHNLPCQLQPTSFNGQSIDVCTVEAGVYVSSEWKLLKKFGFIEEQSRNNISTTILTLSDEEKHRLGDGYSYTVQSFLKEVTTETGVRDWDKNFRIGVFNNPIAENQRTIVIPSDNESEPPTVINYDSTDYDNLTTQDIIGNAEFWSNCPKSANTYENVECEFRYDKDYPLYILICGDYVPQISHSSVTFTEPCIVETEYYNQRVSNGIYPVPIDDLILNDGSTSDINIPQQNNSDTLVFYNLPLPDNFGTNTETAIRGLQIKGTFEQNTDDLILFASLVNSKNESRQRSITLDENLNTNNEFHLGQSGDLWGFNTQDITNLENWEIHLNLSNTLNNYTGTANFGNIQLIIYTETIEHQNIKCYINDEDISYYGAFITNITIPPGLETDTSYITVDGTDVNDPYRQNIKSKTIEIEFDIGDNCDLEGATLSLRELTKLLTNRRDKYNRPIPKRIEFSHYPDVYWEYVMEESIDAPIEISSYTAKAKLTIPAGTSYTKKPTSTNTTGYISGLAAIRPLIQVSPTDNIFSITETVSEQEFNMGYSGDWTGKVVEIDCDNRIVWLKENEEDTEPTNISKYVDFNADFFVLYEEYNFTSEGCVVRSVDYEERW